MQKFSSLTPFPPQNSSLYSYIIPCQHSHYRGRRSQLKLPKLPPIFRFHLSTTTQPIHPHHLQRATNTQNTMKKPRGKPHLLFSSLTLFLVSLIEQNPHLKLPLPASSPPMPTTTNTWNNLAPLMPTTTNSSHANYHKHKNHLSPPHLSHSMKITQDPPVYIG